MELYERSMAWELKKLLWQPHCNLARSYIATYWEHCHLQDYRRGGFLGVTDRGGDSKSEKVIAFLQELFDVKFKNQDQRLFLLSMALTNAKKVSSGTTYIPEDIVFSILSKLPIKSLKRFSSVQKSWSRLFENHIFIEMFRNNLLSKSHSLYDGVSLILNLIQELYHWNFYLLSDGKFENKLKLDFPYVFHPHASIVCVLGSAINGILCIYDYNHSSYTKAVLWKFVTGEVMVIPISNLSYEFRYVYVTLHGFGYDHVRDDYKVIQHAAYIKYNPSYDGKWKNFREIYSLKSNSWRKLDFDMPARYTDTDTDVYLNGVCHWWGKRNNEIYLVSFNVSDEVYFTTSPPFENVRDDFDDNLTVLNGYVAMISSYKNTMSFHIWILGEFGVKESWIRLFDIGPLSCISYRSRDEGKYILSRRRWRTFLF
ncbi:F-box/kelch-repeat protein [Trifolium repens]|nr:F-box/kelch-repeat protein [Trifolium repens]